MNLSMDRSYTLCLLARSALFAASVLALGTTMVVAQEGQPVPKSTPKATLLRLPAPLLRRLHLDPVLQPTKRPG